MRFMCLVSGQGRLVWGKVETVKKAAQGVGSRDPPQDLCALPQLGQWGLQSVFTTEATTPAAISDGARRLGGRP